MSIVQAECRLKSLTNTAVCYGISAHWLSADALSECWAGTCSNWPSPSGPWSLRGRRGRRWALRTSPTETSNSWSTSSEDTTSLSADLTPGTCTHPGQLTGKKTLNNYFLSCIVFKFSANPLYRLSLDDLSQSHFQLLCRPKHPNRAVSGPSDR